MQRVSGGLSGLGSGTCQKLAGGEGGWKQRGGHNFLSLRKGRGHEKWAVKRGRVMQIYARDHVEVHPQKKKEVLYLAKKREKYIIIIRYGLCIGRNRRVE